MNDSKLNSNKRNRKSGRLAIALVLMTGMAWDGVTQTVGADAWQIQPSVSLQGSYDDNARMIAEGEKDQVFATSLIGELELSRLSEVFETRGVLRWDAIKYSGDDDRLQDRDNQLARLQHVTKGELHEWGLEASYRRDTLLRTVNVSFDAEDDVELEPDDDVDDVLVRRSVRRNRTVIRPNWTRDLSERWRLLTEYRYNNVAFDDIGAETLTDYTDHTVTLGTQYDLSELDIVSLAVDANRYTADDFDRTYESVAVRTGYSHQFSELMTGVVDVGVSRVSFDTETESGDNTGIIFNVGGSRRTALTRFTGTIGRRLYPSGSGDVIRSDELVFRMNRKLTELSGLKVRARLFENEALSRDRPEANRRFLLAEAGWNKRITRWWTVEASYRYRRQKRDIDPDNAESNAVFLSVKYTRPSDLGDVL